jgi:hypothetical protein
LNSPANIDEIVAVSELNRGKVLGNLPRLNIDGFVDKRGKRYIITKNGSAIIRELGPIPADKGFYFYLKENFFTGLLARSFMDFYEIIGIVDVESIEYHIHQGDFEKWIREVLGDDELADEIADLKLKDFSGEVLRDKLREVVGKKIQDLDALESQ